MNPGFRLIWAALAMSMAPCGHAQLTDQFGAGPILTGVTNLTGSNLLATAEPGEPAHVGEPASRSVWARWTPTVTGTYSISTSNSMTPAGTRMDTLLAVYTGSALESLSPVVGDDDVVPFNVWSRVIFRAYAGETFHLAVDGTGGTPAGNINLQIGMGGPLMAPWAAVDLEGRPINSGDFSNHVLLVDFWETTCTVCVQELGDLVQLYQTYHPRGFEIVGLSCDPDEELVYGYFNRNPRPSYAIGMASVSSLASIGGPNGFPTKYFIDQERRIVGRYLGQAPLPQTPLQYYSGVLDPLMRLPPEIRLQAARDGGAVRLSWPISSAAFKVEAADQPGDGWTEIALTVQTNSDHVTAVLPVEGPARYFRLKKP